MEIPYSSGETRCNPLEMAESIVFEAAKLFSEDETYYRSTFIAVENLDRCQDYHEAAGRAYDWGARLIRLAVEACVEAKLTSGRIPIALLSEQISRTYRASCRAWAYGQISLEEFRQTALTDIYISLSADAIDTFRRELGKKIRLIEEMKSDSHALPSITAANCLMSE